MVDKAAQKIKVTQLAESDLTVLQQIIEELTLLDADLRAEVVIATLKNTATPLLDDFTVHPKSTFSRTYDYDVMKLHRDPKVDNTALGIDISRNSIYDLLPEAIFHESQIKEQESFNDYRKQLQAESKEARKLFLPIDNALFEQRIALEEKEQQAIVNFSSLKDDFLLDFWGLDKKLPHHYSRKLLQLLPHADKISANLELAFRCLSHCINATVNYRKEFDTRKIKQPENNGMQLGLDFVLQQKELLISQPELHITIVAKDTEEAAAFLESDMLDFAETFYDYFIPIEFEIQTKIAIKANEDFTLSETEGSLMGISTRL